MHLLKKYSLQLAWLQALVASLGSLYFTEIKHFPPCNLCWYQRAFMFPLVFILGVGIWKKDKGVVKYALPLVLGGLLIALYQTIIYYKIIAEPLTACTIAVSCTTKYVTWLGFISIPLLSLVAFGVILGLLILHRRK